ncbi:Aromatic ring-opening dioxygenase, catalytic subunit, LigB family [Metschnikowia aff. pulcherrima]|uniref:Aromatic ring-opening dioxygenase, catalytic subunit, LigB family n=1 Tax=Metschnikowia aff. pulcherrima TaxID=2163413 RepID=A0A4P6XH43_9ASCO|nr:Aromatic ring-opening dioxygenase, catalytic subunit, LigB family [Metschnikowia aff. pulcherrima]
MPVRIILRVLASAAIAYMAFRMSTQITGLSKLAAPMTQFSAKSAAETIANVNPLPTLFVSHGGPTFIYENDETGNKGAWRAIRGLGTVIKKKWKPDYIIVVSAHWQLNGSKSIEVAVPPRKSLFGQKAPETTMNGDWVENPLIYDFYGFPDHMYKEKFRTWNSRFLSQLISEHLEENGFRSKLTERGLDHGAWVPLKVAFPQGPGESDMALPETPLIQVSLTGVESDFKTHARLGEVLSHFQNNMIWDPVREKHLRGLVICSGMSVHNLRDLGLALHSGGRTMPYVPEFSKILSKTMQSGPNVLNGLESLKTEHSALLRKAHPTVEHFVPIVVAAGVNKASGDRKVTEVYTADQLSMAWGTYQFGAYSP